MHRNAALPKTLFLIAIFLLAGAATLSAQVVIGGSTQVPAAVVAIKPVPRFKVQTGDDGWTTPAGTTTRAFFDNVTVPGGCGLSDGTLSGFVNLLGEPLPSNNPGGVGNVDTVVRRLNTTPHLNMGASATVGLQIQGLNLVSESPVSVTCAGPDPTFDVRAALSEATAQPVGSITFTRNHSDGGTFSSSLNVIPKFILSPTAGGSDIVIDCGDAAVDCGSEEQLNFTSSNSPWALSGGPSGWQPGDTNIGTLPSGALIDGDGNGTLETTLIGSSNGFPGVDPNDQFRAARIRELELLAEHEAEAEEEEEQEPCRTQQTVSRDARGRTTVIIIDCEPIEPDLVKPVQISF